MGKGGLVLDNTDASQLSSGSSPPVTGVVTMPRGPPSKVGRLPALRRVASPEPSTEEQSFMDLTREQLVAKLIMMQGLLIEKDQTIYKLNEQVIKQQTNECRKQELLRGFRSIEQDTVDTSTVETVMHDCMHHLLCTISEICKPMSAGILLLDTPGNAMIGAKNRVMRNTSLLKSYWSVTPTKLEEDLEDLQIHKTVIVQKMPKYYTNYELLQHPDLIASGLQSLVSVPIVIDNRSVAVLILANGEMAPTDPKLLYELLPEVWSSSIFSLLNVAMDKVRHQETEARLAAESAMRDDIILSLEGVLDGIMKKHSLSSRAKTSRELWTETLTTVSNFFEDYFSCTVLIAVTNTEANQRLHTRRGSNCSERTGENKLVGLQFVHYIFSDSAKIVRNTKMKDFEHPQLRENTTLYKTLQSGKVFYSPDGTGLNFPVGHMKVNSMLIVPIVFLDEPVGMLGLANGEFGISTGRILQSVFTTFWSMIVRATLISENQRVLNAALPVAISERVKRGENIADSYDHATVLFADIVGFTNFTRELESDMVVEYSNLIFRRLDHLVQEYGLEKIKVIGDCYMVVGGVQDKTKKSKRKDPFLSVTDDPQIKQMAKFAIRILHEARLINERVESLGSEAIREGLKEKPLKFRIGVAEGPLTAGVFGTEKVQYDVLGATVNLASRLESTGCAGKIQVSPSVYEALCDDKEFSFERREPIAIKGFGNYQTYFLTSNNPIIM